MEIDRPGGDQPLQSPAPATRGRRRQPACLRCRQRKTKCDGQLPQCGNCVKAQVECDHDGSVDKAIINQLQARIRLLESTLKGTAPDGGLDAAVTASSQTQSPSVPSPARAQVQVGDAQPHAPHLPFQAPSQSALHVQSPALVQPEASPNVPSQGSQSEPTPASVISSQIGPEQPLAHDVGLLSLANAASSDPKYLGPSSGVTFARIIYAAAPQSQGIPSNWRGSSTLPENPTEQNVLDGTQCVPLPPAQEMHRLVDAYFNSFQHSYPFLQEDRVDKILEEKLQSSSNPVQNPPGTPDADLALLFLVAALGARSLEINLNLTLGSSNYLASAMSHISALQLHDSLLGIQLMLLLVLSSFFFQGGMNAWFLTSTIIASCIDLGLQRKSSSSRQNHGTSADSEATLLQEDFRSAIFWSAYSIDRTLAVTLGRPLTLRDEAIDIEFPGEGGTGYSSYPATVLPSPLQQIPPRASSGSSAAKRPRLDLSFASPYVAANFSFRFDRITAEIKLMLYRVVQVPSRFPWPTSLQQWQVEAFSSCKMLLLAAQSTLSSRRATHSRRSLPAIELKYHQCVMLLFRPSPAIPRPSDDALLHCFTSAVEVIHIHASQLKFGEMANSWLTAHLVFVSGITMLYTFWITPNVTFSGRMAPNIEENSFTRSVRACSDVLGHLSLSWSVARAAKEKFDRLAQLTQDNLNSNTSATSNHGPGDVTGLRTSDISQHRPPPRGEPTLTGGHMATTADNGLWNETGEYGNAPYEGNGFGALEMPDFLLEHLGDMTGLFDLDWVGDQRMEREMWDFSSAR